MLQLSIGDPNPHPRLPQQYLFLSMDFFDRPDFLDLGDGPYSSFRLLPAMLPEAQILKCRCGAVGDGDDMQRLINTYGDTVPCNVCDLFSHTACQRVEQLENATGFLCEACDIGRYFKIRTPEHVQRCVLCPGNGFCLTLTIIT